MPIFHPITEALILTILFWKRGGDINDYVALLFNQSMMWSQVFWQQNSSPTHNDSTIYADSCNCYLPYVFWHFPVFGYRNIRYIGTQILCVQHKYSRLAACNNLQSTISFHNSFSKDVTCDAALSKMPKPEEVEGA